MHNRGGPGVGHRIDPEDSWMHLRSTDCSHTCVHPYTRKRCRARNPHAHMYIHTHTHERTRSRERYTNAGCNSHRLRKLSGELRNRRRLGSTGLATATADSVDAPDVGDFNVTFNARPLKLSSYANNAVRLCLIVIKRINQNESDRALIASAVQSIPRGINIYLVIPKF